MIVRVSEDRPSFVTENHSKAGFGAVLCVVSASRRVELRKTGQ
jgi:hypothetical protein